MTRRVVVLPDADALARSTASRLLLALVDAQSQHSPVHIVLTGGGAGTATLAAAAVDPLAEHVDWSAVHLWWGDERFLPSGDPERNETGARAALIDPLGDRLPAANVHPVPGPGPATPDPESAARAYRVELAAWAPAGEQLPRFDVLLLGVGPDAHVASLFPGLPGPQVDDEIVVGVHDSPKPPPLRVSLTFPAIRTAAQVWLVAAGAEKAAAVASALSGASPEQVPAAGAVGREQTLWLLDAAAAAVAATEDD
ncbi:6-phosphogluconolactonase [Cellulomonas citrea]|uniref:6-phosphogluconolactonase n=1 Tax=Cellulomonas citrea TaxID=1909423 RepID=UPI00135C9A3E|nr:6-phosphogluconolactonase [Cellulomonas citrea]